MRALIATLFLAGLVLTGAAQEPEKKPEKQPEKQPPDPTEPPVSDLRGLPGVVEGGYTVAHGERGGQPIPAEELKDAIVRFTGGRVVGTDKDRTEILVATYTLDTTKNPWAIEMRRYDGAIVGGIVKKEKFVLTIAFADPGGETPTEFKTKEKQRMYVLRAFVLDPLPPPNKFSSAP